MNNGLVVMGDGILQCEIHLRKAFSKYFCWCDKALRRTTWSRNEVGLVVAVVTTATEWFMQLVLTAATTLVVITVLELIKRSYRSDSDTWPNLY